MTHDDLIIQYKLDKKKLHRLFDKIVEFLEDKGVTITYTDLEPIVEPDIYVIDRELKNEDKHHESCISDGMEIYLHSCLEDIGGICGRLYDILHVGCGHLYQWSASDDSHLEFKGDKAWSIGSTYHLHAGEDKLREVWNYESEAGVLALENLKKILRQYKFDKTFSKKMIRFFNDYLKTDLNYITSFYRTGITQNFFDDWQYNSLTLPMINLDFKLHIKRRTNKCIALINVRQSLMVK